MYLLTSNAYPSKPKIDGVGSGKYYEKKKNAKYISSLHDCDWMKNPLSDRSRVEWGTMRGGTGRPTKLYRILLTEKTQV